MKKRTTPRSRKNGKPRARKRKTSPARSKKPAGAALWDSHALLHAVFDLTTDALFVKDLRGRYRTINAAGARLLGRSTEDVIGKDDRELCSPETARRIMERDRRIMTAGSTETFEEVATAAGTARTWLTTESAYRNRAGRVIGLIGIARDMTEHKRAEADQLFFKHIYQTHDPVYGLSPEEGFRFAYVNEATCRHYGYSAEELLRMSVPDWDPNYPLVECERLWQDLKSVKSRTFETQHRRFNGDVVPVEMTANYVAFGGKEYIVGTIRDITERKRVEEKLQKNQMILEQALHVGKLGSWYWDIPTNTVTWSGQLYQLYGLEPDEFSATYEGFLSLVHPEDRDAVRTTIESTYRSGRSYHLEFRVPKSDGTMWWNHSRGQVIRDAGGRPLAMIGVAQDITERKRAEERLRQSEQQFRLMMENMTDLVAVLDLEGNLLYTSSSYTNIFDERESPTHTSLFADIHPKDRERIRRIFLDTVATGAEHRTEFRFLLKDGSIRHIESQGNLIRDEDGTPARVIVVSRDITARKQIEKALHKREEQLWQLLGERERLSQNLHDNIIQRVYAIGLGLEQCQQQLPDDPAEPLSPARLLEHAIAELNVVIRDVRNYISGIEPGLASAIQLQAELAELITTSNGISSLRFTLKLDPMASARLNPEEAQHVLFIVREAISNSLRHSGAKNGTVSLQLENGGLRLTVEDDGVGFDAQAGHASGNGLRNIAARARMLGARLEVLSTPRQGTHLLITFHKEPDHASRQNE